MGYEYEKYIKNAINTEAVFSHEKEKRQERIEELKEVYRKAKAWDNYIAEVKDRVRFTENTKEDVENETQKVIDYYMEDD